MSEFKEGQRVKIEFEATVGGNCRYSGVEFVTDDGLSYYVETEKENSVKITRLDPAGWPPQVGDIWATRDTSEPASESVVEWFCRKMTDGEIGFCPDEAGPQWETPAAFLRLNPRLVRRRGE